MMISRVFSGLSAVFAGLDIGSSQDILIGVVISSNGWPPGVSTWLETLIETTLCEPPGSAPVLKKATARWPMTCR